MDISEVKELLGREFSFIFDNTNPVVQELELDKKQLKCKSKNPNCRIASHAELRPLAVCALHSVVL